jgi:hypothetical protein
MARVIDPRSHRNPCTETRCTCVRYGSHNKPSLAPDPLVLKIISWPFEVTTSSDLSLEA